MPLFKSFFNGNNLSLLEMKFSYLYTLCQRLFGFRIIISYLALMLREEERLVGAGCVPQW